MEETWSFTGYCFIAVAVAKFSAVSEKAKDLPVDERSCYKHAREEFTLFLLECAFSFMVQKSR